MKVVADVRADVRFGDIIEKIPKLKMLKFLSDVRLDKRLISNRYVASVIIETVNEKLEEYFIKLNSITDGGENCLKITLSVNAEDYNGLLKKVLPEVLKKVEDGRLDNIATSVIELLGYDIYDMMDAISDSKKEKLIAMLVNKFEEKICEGLTNMLEQRDVPLKIDNITVC